LQPNLSYTPFKTWQASQELRTDVTVNSRFNFTTGVYGLWDRYILDQNSLFAYAAPGLMAINLEDQHNWSASVFGQGYYHLTDKLQLLAGVRYTHEYTSMLASDINGLVPPGSDYSTDGYLGAHNLVALPPGSTLLSVTAPPKASTSWNQVGAKAGANYQFTEDAMGYLLWAHGFKSGGFVGRVGLPEDIGPFHPEHLDSFEAGAKTEWLDHRLRVNGALFYNLYHDLQVAGSYYVHTTNAQGQPVFVQGNTVLNAPKAEIKGVEMESQAILGGGFSMNGSVTYLDAVYKNFPVNVGLDLNGNPLPPQQYAGKQLQDAPKWQFMIGGNYEFALFQGQARLHAQYSFTGQKYMENQADTPGALLVANKLVDASLNWDPNDAKWGVSLWGRNLTDQHYFAFMYDVPGFGQVGAYGEPRTFGVTVHYGW
jgi:iron complex outermembrane receptor protein